MEIKQFEDKNLSIFSYAISHNGCIALIDPVRNPKQYYDYASERDETIVAIIETHPHADFVSGHLEIHQKTSAPIYVSKYIAATYAHTKVDDGDPIPFGGASFTVLMTPGHSPDSISLLLKDIDTEQKWLFTGDCLFAGDCGRPDLREEQGNKNTSREVLAHAMFHSLRKKILTLPDDTILCAAHGAGTLCGKSVSDSKITTLSIEKKNNWSLQDMPEKEFVFLLLKDQPFVPKYFSFDVSLNKKGADNFQESILKVKKREPITCLNCATSLNPHVLIIDTRPQEKFKNKHLKNSINLMLELKFETWLGSIISPHEPFYLTAENEEILQHTIERIAKIGYESQIELAFVSDFGTETIEKIHIPSFQNKLDNYTIIDIRNPSEREKRTIFTQSIHIPLYELRERISEIPTHKPIVVHCAGGYRSAAGSSILKTKIPTVPIYDLSSFITLF